MKALSKGVGVHVALGGRTGVQECRGPLPRGSQASRTPDSGTPVCRPGREAHPTPTVGCHTHYTLGVDEAAPCPLLTTPRGSAQLHPRGPWQAQGWPGGGAVGHSLTGRRPDRDRKQVLSRKETRPAGPRIPENNASCPASSPFHSPWGGLRPWASPGASRFLQTPHPVACPKIGALSGARDGPWQVHRQLGLFQPWRVVSRQEGPGSRLWASPAGAPGNTSRAGCPGWLLGLRGCQRGGERLLPCAWPSSPPLLLQQQPQCRLWPPGPLCWAELVTASTPPAGGQASARALSCAPVTCAARRPLLPCSSPCTSLPPGSSPASPVCRGAARQRSPPAQASPSSLPPCQHPALLPLSRGPHPRWHTGQCHPPSPLEPRTPGGRQGHL